MQRDRHFDHYQDDAVFYEKRPNLWTEPQGDWGAGAVMLYEIPTTSEYEDNIVAFWTPRAPASAGARFAQERKRSGTGKRVSVRVDLGGGGTIKNKKNKNN